MFRSHLGDFVNLGYHGVDFVQSLTFIEEHEIVIMDFLHTGAPARHLPQQVINDLLLSIQTVDTVKFGWLIFINLLLSLRFLHSVTEIV